MERPYRSISVTQGAPNLGQNHRLLKFVPSPSAKIQFEIKHIFSNTLKTPALLGPNREETVMKQEKGKDGRDEGRTGLHWGGLAGRTLTLVRGQVCRRCTQMVGIRIQEG